MATIIIIIDIVYSALLGVTNNITSLKLSFSAKSMSKFLGNSSFTMINTIMFIVHGK